MDKVYGYLGPQGTYCEEALCKYLGNKEEKRTPFPSIEQVLAAVKDNSVTHGLIPLENSIEGTVNIAIDMIASEPELKIVGEVILPVRHNLLIKPGARREDIRIIISHPQALAQCRNYLNKNFPGAVLKPVNSTAEAAQAAAADDGSVAAIGNKKAGYNYGLVVAEEGIQDCLENRTRFVLVSKQKAPVTGAAKTSLVLSITDRPGGLYQILKEFALANINLTKIESRPAKTSFGDYLFFIDLVGHAADPVVKKCLESIEDMSASFRVLGSYTVWEEPERKNRTAGAEKTTTLTLEELRQNIDIIDYQIVDLLAQRTQLVSLVGNLKNGLDGIRDETREGEVLNRVKNNAVKKGVSAELIEQIYRDLFNHFVDLQRSQQI